MTASPKYAILSGKIPLLVKLVSNGDWVDLTVTDSAGATWTVLQLTTEGQLERVYGLPDGIGLTIDSDGRIDLAN